MKKVCTVMILLVVAFQLLIGCGKTTVGPDDTPAEIRTVDCSLCHGAGICYHCDGEAFRDGRRCSVCDGAGKCSRCYGAGEIEVLEIGGKDYIRCSPCGTSGVCPMCDGSGDMGSYGGAGSKCMLCRGRGKCIGCNGEGIVPLRGF